MYDSGGNTKSVSNGPDNRSSNPCKLCGEQYFTGHRCKSQQRFKCLELGEYADQEEVDEVLEGVKEPETSTELEEG